jgi:hypothetical protein
MLNKSKIRIAGMLLVLLVSMPHLIQLGYPDAD